MNFVNEGAEKAFVAASGEMLSEMGRREESAVGEFVDGGRKEM